MLSSLRFALAIALFIVPVTAKAEPVALPVADTFMSGFPADQDIDMLGVELGMTYDEVYAIMSEKYPSILSDARDAEYKSYTETKTIALRSPDGFLIEFEPTNVNLQIYQEAPNGDRNKASRFEFVFGTSATGGRLQAMARKAFFEKPALKLELVPSLVEKYDVAMIPPEKMNGGAILYSAFNDGVRIPNDESLAFKCSEKKTVRGNAFQFGRSALMSGPNDFYYQLSDRKAPQEGNERCDASIRIDLSEIASFPDQIGLMKIYIVDNLAAYQDLKAIDDAIDAAYDTFLNQAPTETTKPEL